MTRIFIFSCDIKGGGVWNPPKMLVRNIYIFKVFVTSFTLICCRSLSFVFSGLFVMPLSQILCPLS